MLHGSSAESHVLKSLGNREGGGNNPERPKCRVCGNASDGTKKGVEHCYGCGAGGGIINALTQIVGPTIH